MGAVNTSVNEKNTNDVNTYFLEDEITNLDEFLNILT
jgi:hypothetical protein